MGEEVRQIEKDYMDVVASLGCIITGKPAVLHHPRFCVGMSQRASNFLVIPLAPELHTGKEFYGQSIHHGQPEFESKYGREEELLARTIEKVFSVNRL